MIRPWFFLMLSFVSPAVSAAAELKLYVYDSFAAKGGLGEAWKPLYEKSTGCTVRYLPSGDGAQVLTRVELDAKRGKYAAEAALGIDQQLWPRARPHASVAKFSDGSAGTVPEAQVAPGFYAFDYGVFAFMADLEELKKRGLVAPSSFRALLQDAKFAKQFVLEDPRTSTPGLGFLLNLRALGAERFTEALRNLKGKPLTYAPGWDAAYGIFLKKEAPLVWSYTTSRAYHDEHGEKGKYEALVFEEGNGVQVEGIVLLEAALRARGEDVRRCAQRWVEFARSMEAQALVAKRNWMLPVRSAVALPESFATLPKPKRTFALAVEKASETADAIAAWKNSQ